MERRFVEFAQRHLFGDLCEHREQYRNYCLWHAGLVYYPDAVALGGGWLGRAHAHFYPRGLGTALLEPAEAAALYAVTTGKRGVCLVAVLLEFVGVAGVSQPVK